MDTFRCTSHLSHMVEQFNAPNGPMNHVLFDYVMENRVRIRVWQLSTQSDEGVQSSWSKFLLKPHQDVRVGEAHFCHSMENIKECVEPQMAPLLRNMKSMGFFSFK